MHKDWTSSLFKKDGLKFVSLLVVFTTCLGFCGQKREESGTSLPQHVDWIEHFERNPEYQARGFVYPVGKNGSGKRYYVAQGFGKKNKRFGGNKHLGEDWNGVGGGDTDYGDPVLAIANGYVVYVGYGGYGWGDVIRIVHYKKIKDKVVILESVYGHISKAYVVEKQFVKKAEKIAEIGDAGGLYPAHLHLELRDDPELELGGGYSSDTTGFLDPRKFIKKHGK